MVTCQKQVGRLLSRRRKPHSDHICANGQIAKVYSPNGLTTQAAKEGGETDGNLVVKE